MSWVPYVVPPVVLTLGLPIGRFLIVRLWPKPWPVRAGGQWHAGVPAVQAQRRVEEFAAARCRWRIVSSEPGRVDIMCGLTWASWSKHIMVALIPASDTETFVRVTSSSPQLLDWGDGSRTVAALFGALPPAQAGAPCPPPVA